MASGTDKKKKLVLICIDDSEHSRHAFEWYFTNLHQAGDRVGIIHIYSVPAFTAYGLYSFPAGAIEVYREHVKKSVDESKVIIEKYKNMLSDKGVADPVVLFLNVDESIGHTICEAAKKHQPDLVIIGQRGLGVVRSTLFGSVSHYILHHLDIPVVVVPPEKSG